ncbi:MAG: hypothetical protein CME06_00155 [Gemmatimonadetes bacterium]|nr:hypothetical protein [Gemmatimonadota bacterium]
MKNPLGSMAAIGCSLLIGACAPPGAGSEDMVRMVLPEGDVAAGRKALQDLRCTLCHTVKGESRLAAPSTASPGPELRGPSMSGLSRGAVATAVVAPAHVNVESAELWTDWSDRQRVWLGPGQQLEEDVPEERSRMRNYGDVMTVQQLCDLVAYLEVGTD